MEIEREQGEVLIASPGRELARSIEPHLAPDGLSVRTVDGYEAIRGQPSGWDPVLVVVDLQSPTSAWLEQCWEARADSRAPMIVILPWPDPDKATAILNLGADDCLARPISPRELTLRIRAVLRRTTYVRLPIVQPSRKGQDANSVPRSGAVTRRRRS